MSISPPSDIVLDVVRAADPARYKQATARLGPTAAAATAFAETLQATEVGAEATAPTGAKAANDNDAAKAAETNRRFESMVLASLLESSMTGSFGEYFGKGVAGETWKSLLVEQIADQIAKAGGIGIATQMARSGATAVTTDGEAAGPAAQSLIVSTIERSMLRTLDPEEPTG